MWVEPPLFDVTAAMAAVDWAAYRKCSQVCRAETGKPCFALSGKVVGGQPDGVITELDHPHVSRKRRTGR